VKNKALPGLDEPFDYDLLAQLANVPARITMYDLLRLSPDIRQAVVKALSEADKYAPHVHQIEVHDVYKSEAYKRRWRRRSQTSHFLDKTCCYGTFTIIVHCTFKDILVKSKSLSASRSGVSYQCYTPKKGKEARDPHQEAEQR